MWQEELAVDKASKLPLYHQIATQLEGLIDAGRIKVGEPLIPDGALANLLGVSRLTVRSAVDSLVQKGLVVRRHGVGTFVAMRTPPMIFPSELSFTKNIREIGRRPSSIVVSMSSITAPDDVARYLGLENGEPVHKLIRVRQVDDEAVMVETTFLSRDRFPTLDEVDLEHGSLHSYLLENHGVEIVAQDQAIEPCAIDENVARMLNVEPGTPGLWSELIGFDQQANPVEYTRAVSCAGRSRMCFHFRKTEANRTLRVQDRDISRSPDGGPAVVQAGMRSLLQ